MKVYLVTAGEYSDFRVVCVCSTHEKAQEIADRFGGEVDDRDMDSGPLHEGLNWWEARMGWDGAGANAFQQMPYGDDDREARPYFIDYRGISNWDKAPLHERFGLRVTCWAKDEQHAIKIANEIRLSIIAEGQKPS